MNSIVFEECDLEQNWFVFDQKVEEIHRFDQSYIYDDASEVLKDNTSSIEEISSFECNFSSNNQHKNFKSQRKSSEDLWSLCDLKSQYEDSCLLNGELKADSIIEEKEAKKLCGVESDVHTNCVSQSLSSQQQKSNCYSSSEINESIEVEAKVKLCINRKDVVIKSILRSMRKYYADILEEKCGFDRKMRNIKQKHNSLISSSIEIVDKLKLDYVSKSLPFYIAAIAFPNEVKKILQKSCKVNPEMKSDYVKCSNEIFNIEIALMRYSKKNLAELLNNADISVLLNHYLNKVHNSEYEEHYKILKDMSRKTIDNIQANGDSEIKSFGAEFCEIRV